MTEWRVVPSFPWLEASSDGRVRRCLDSMDGRRRRGDEIVGSINKAGYVEITIQQGKIRKGNTGKHTLVCEAFHGRKPTPSHEALHGDGVPHHNAADNLRWGTRKENAADRRRHGRDTIGMRHHSAKLTETDVIEIRILKQLGFTGFGLSAMYAIDRNHANRVAAGAAWAHLATTSSGDPVVIGALSFGS